MNDSVHAPRPCVFVVGDLIIDIYVSGSSTRISPEAPVPIVLSDSTKIFLGGSGNVALNLLSLGCDVTFLSIASREQEAQLGDHWNIYGGGIDFTLVRPFPLAKAPVKTRFYSDGHCMLRVDEELAPKLTHLYRTKIDTAIRRRAKRILKDQLFDAIVISDYDKGVLSIDAISALVDHSEKKQIPLFIDTKKSAIGCLGPNSVIKPNLIELNCLLQGSGYNQLSSDSISNYDADPSLCLDALRSVSKITGAGTVVLTTGGIGAFVYCRDSNHIEAHKTTAQQACDVSGAGDTFFASYISNWCEYRSPGVACQAANYFAGCAVKTTGTYLPAPTDLYRYARLNGGAAGIVYVEELAEYLHLHLPRSERSEYTLGFTNGCFDILHPGHIAYLREARACCDILVCGINSDSSVQMLKGPTRPVHGEIYRSQALLALGSIDLVVIFSEPSPSQLIQLLKPDLLIKGGDYSVDNIVGADYVKSYGGRVVTMPLVNGFSTSNIIKQVMERAD